MVPAADAGPGDVCAETALTALAARAGCLQGVAVRCSKRHAGFMRAAGRCLPTLRRCMVLGGMPCDALDHVCTSSAMLTCTLLSVHSVGFKHRAPKGVKAVQKWAADLMGTKDVRLDPKANQVIWGLGVKDVPRRLRFRLERE